MLLYNIQSIVHKVMNYCFDVKQWFWDTTLISWIAIFRTSPAGFKGRHTRGGLVPATSSYNKVSSCELAIFATKSSCKI